MDRTALLASILAAIAIIGLVVVAIVKTAPTSPERDTLTVSGTKEFFVAPDEAQLTLSVVERADTAKEASARNRERFAAMTAALGAQGVQPADIETTGVTLQKIQEWDKKNETYVEKGYEHRTTVRVTVKDLEKVGDVLDAAIDAGANNVEDVQFTLRPETEERYKQEGLQDAAGIARNKATLMAEAAGARLGDPTNIHENSYYMPFTSNVAEFDGMDEKRSTGGLGPERVSLTVSVSITYALE